MVQVVDVASCAGVSGLLLESTHPAPVDQPPKSELPAGRFSVSVTFEPTSYVPVHTCPPEPVYSLPQ